MLISYGSGFRSRKKWSVSFSLSRSLSLYYKSFDSAAQTVLVSPLVPFHTMRINYIKAGLVNLAGASCRKGTESSNSVAQWRSFFLVLCLCVWSSFQTDARPCSPSSFHFHVNKSVWLFSFGSPPWIDPTFKCVHCVFRGGKPLGSGESAVGSWAMGGQLWEECYQIWLIVTHYKTMCLPPQTEYTAQIQDPRWFLSVLINPFERLWDRIIGMSVLKLIYLIHGL